jgi:tetratricopeptide (TPR) repeat protein
MVLKPDEPTVHFDLGLNARDTGSLGEAAAHFAKALDLEPGYAKAHDEAGQIWALQGDYAEAKRHYLAAIRLDPKNPSPHSGLASALANQRDFAGAAEEATKAIAVDPGWGHGHYVLGFALYYQGKLEEAATAFREAVRFGRAEGGAWLGLIHHDAGDLRQALVELHGAVEHESEGPLSRVMARVELTLALLDAGEPEEALRNAREADRLYPSSRTASALGDALTAHANWKDAREAYSTAVKRDPKGAGAHAKLAASLVRTGDLAGARGAYERVLALQPTAAETIEPEFALVRRLLEMERALPLEDAALAKREVPYRADMAELMAIRREWAASAGIFESVFSEDPAVFDWDLRELPSIAAVAAAEAAESDGDARWKRLAIAWLRKFVAGQAREKDPESVPDRRKSLSRLKVNPALSGIRSPKALAALGTEDREAALLLWGEVDLLLDRLRP